MQSACLERTRERDSCLDFKVMESGQRGRVTAAAGLIKMQLQPARGI